jgi:hypothetical protein
MLRRAAGHHAAPEVRLEPQPFATSDQVLLFCFGLDQSAERSSRQLRKALSEAGFSFPAAREIVRASPLIHRTAVGTYRLRRLNTQPLASKPS